MDKPKVEELINELGFRCRNMFSRESIERGMNFTPRATDIFISTAPKAGTTWCMQICHTLRTAGHMDFDEITCVVPWDEAAGTTGQDLDAEQIANPRLFKSHCTYDQITKGARYIYVARNPSDCLVSFYHFIVPYFGYSEDDISFEDFASIFFFKGQSSHGSIFPHLLSWWKERENPNVLWLFFEDLKEDLPACVRKIADFMHIPLTAELEGIVLEKASFRYMREHASQFDDHFVRNAAYAHLQLTDSEGFKVGKGTSLCLSPLITILLCCSFSFFPFLVF